jgi:hypothetical protein
MYEKSSFLNALTFRGIHVMHEIESSCSKIKSKGIKGYAKSKYLLCKTLKSHKLNLLYNVDNFIKFSI